MKSQLPAASLHATALDEALPCHVFFYSFLFYQSVIRMLEYLLTQAQFLLFIFKFDVLNTIDVECISFSVLVTYLYITVFTNYLFLPHSGKSSKGGEEVDLSEII